MVLDDLLEDMFEREDKPRKRRGDEEDEGDERKRKYDEEDEEEYYGEKENKNKERGRKRGFFDRLTELFD